MAHTPGPWEIGGKTGLLVIGYDARLYPENERCTIAQVDPNGDKLSEDINKANIRLIIAAPDLLRVVKNLMAVCEGELGSSFENCNDAIMAIDVIARAEAR